MMWKVIRRVWSRRGVGAVLPGRLGLLAALAAPVLVSAQSPDGPFARARLEPDATVIVGQPLGIVVEVLVPSFFTGAPRFPDLDVPDALVLFDLSRGQNFTERIGGETWAAQARRYTIYPQRPGRYDITEIVVEVRYRDDDGAQSATVSPPPITFTATIPEEARDLPHFIATTELTLNESFDRDPDTLRVGEALARIVEITVRNALSMVIPPLRHDAIPGLGVYPDPPVVDDQGGERGQAITGWRRERVVYVAEEPGEYRLPGIEIAWWDLGAQRLRDARLPEHILQVVQAPEPEAAFLLGEVDAVGEGSSAEPNRGSGGDILRQWGPRAGVILVVLLVGIRVWRRVQPRLRSWWVERQRRRAGSEVAFFHRFRSAARSGDPRAAARQLTFWLDRFMDGGGEAATFARFAARAEDPELDEAARALDARLYAPPPAGRAEAGVWSGDRLYRLVARARRREREVPPEDRPGGLSPLNP